MRALVMDHVLMRRLRVVSAMRGHAFEVVEAADADALLALLPIVPGPLIVLFDVDGDPAGRFRSRLRHSKLESVIPVLAYGMNPSALADWRVAQFLPADGSPERLERDLPTVLKMASRVEPTTWALLREKSPDPVSPASR